MRALISHQSGYTAYEQLRSRNDHPDNAGQPIFNYTRRCVGDPCDLTNQGSAQDRLRIRVPLLPGTAITMQFKQGELTGFSGCNTYHGDYNATANGDGTNTIDIGQLQTSHLTCLQDIMQQEQTYLEILQQANQARNQEN